jgi:hypothetical protein
MNAEVDIETQARALGWSPKEHFKGDPRHWVDAETYVNRGEQIMPILRQNNRKLESELTSTKSELAALKAQLEASNAAIKELKSFNSKTARDAAKATRADLIRGITEAREAGNVEQEVALQDQLDETRAAIREAEKEAAADPEATRSGADPAAKPPLNPALSAAKTVFDTWRSENTWYDEDPVKHGLAEGFAVKLRKEGTDLTGRAFFDEVARQVNAFTGGTKREPPPKDKVEGGGRGNGGGGGGGSSAGHSFADLPADAKAACDKFASRGDISIGKGKTFETLEDWRKHYTNEYFSRE